MLKRIVSLLLISTALTVYAMENQDTANQFLGCSNPFYIGLDSWLDGIQMRSSKPEKAVAYSDEQSKQHNQKIKALLKQQKLNNILNQNKNTK